MEWGVLPLGSHEKKGKVNLLAWVSFIGGIRMYWICEASDYILLDYEQFHVLPSPYFLPSSSAFLPVSTNPPFSIV